MNQLYLEQIDYLSNRYDEWNGYDFYRFIFPNNERVGELNMDYSKPNAIFLSGVEGMTLERIKKIKKENLDDRIYNRRIMLNDTWKDDYIDFVEEKPLTLCSGLSYRGRINHLNSAKRMHALIFDLDEVGGKEVDNVIYSVEKNYIPNPTFIVSSGTGVHIYYVFDQPIDLYPNIKTQLKALKYDLTTKIWRWTETSQLKEPQYQGINQGFRMVGSVNEKHNTPVRAFKTGDRVTLSNMNVHVRDAKNKVDVLKPFKPSKMTREEAKERHPEWYQTRIVEGKNTSKKWNIGGQKGHRGDELYQWWLRQWEKATPGHRYHYLMCLSIYASKCDVPYKQLKKDMLEVFPKIDELDREADPLTIADARAALKAYSKDYYHYTIQEIERLANFRIERNRRNYRKQTQHLKLARAVRDALHDNWRTGSGRKSKQEVISKWRSENPRATKAECARATQLDPKTIRKWWDVAV